MAMTGLLALLDDITTLLDDVAVFSKVAAKKTAGVLGDDLALNAEQVSGVNSDRELPVVWAVAKGSLLNKVILVPLALAISAFLPWLIQPLLMVGGLYLCFEGAEKVHHSLLHRHDKKSPDDKSASIKQETDLHLLEKRKVKGAIRTDFVLSTEVIVIALGAVAGQALLVQAFVVSLVAFIVTVGIYALVGLIVRLDDIGLHLFQSKNRYTRQTGAIILKGAPWVIRLLSIIGTIAMFLVGGGIFVHGLPALHHAVEWLVSGGVAHLPLLPSLINIGVSLLVGGVLGAIIMGAFALLKKGK